MTYKPLTTFCARLSLKIDLSHHHFPPLIIIKCVSQDVVTGSIFERFFVSKISRIFVLELTVYLHNQIRIPRFFIQFETDIILSFIETW